MRAFPVEAVQLPDQPRRAAMVWVTPTGGFVFSVVLEADHSVAIRATDLNGPPLTSIDDLIEAGRGVIDWPRCETELREMQDEARSRRFDHEERRLLARL